MREYNIRKTIEQRERETFSAFAKCAADSEGRRFPVEPCPVRTDFMRDRDRIIHCKSFRRLKHKTQVFLAPAGDHYRTRLTHTLEVSQIARTIARALRLNEDLTEAIALGHDLGHTPFGHAGEEVLNELVEGGFRHNEQSLRVVEKLEGGTGLNLTFEVRDGILNHKKDGNAKTLEGRTVSIADRIAYINHDIDDAIRAEVLSPGDIPKSCERVLGSSHGQRINTMITDVIVNSLDKPEIGMSGEVNAEFNKLRDFMFEKVYLNPSAKREEGKAKHIVRALYLFYLENAELIPREFLKNIDEEGAERVAADHIASMTDRYAISEYKRLFVPTEWI